MFPSFLVKLFIFFENYDIWMFEILENLLFCCGFLVYLGINPILNILSTVNSLKLLNFISHLRIFLFFDKRLYLIDEFSHKLFDIHIHRNILIFGSFFPERLPLMLVFEELFFIYRLILLNFLIDYNFPDDINYC